MVSPKSDAELLQILVVILVLLLFVVEIAVLLRAHL